jgi:hypothetical protein
MDDYHKEQDRIFQEMEDRKRMSDVIEANAFMQQALDDVGMTIDELLKVWKKVHAANSEIDPIALLKAIRAAKTSGTSK